MQVRLIDLTKTLFDSFFPFELFLVDPPKLLVSIPHLLDVVLLSVLSRKNSFNLVELWLGLVRSFRELISFFFFSLLSEKLHVVSWLLIRPLSVKLRHKWWLICPTRVVVLLSGLSRLLIKLYRRSASRTLYFLYQPGSKAHQMENMRAVKLLPFLNRSETDTALQLMPFSSLHIIQLLQLVNELAPLVDVHDARAQSSQVVYNFAKQVDR